MKIFKPIDKIHEEIFSVFFRQSFLILEDLTFLIKVILQRTSFTKFQNKIKLIACLK